MTLLNHAPRMQEKRCHYSRYWHNGFGEVELISRLQLRDPYSTSLWAMQIRSRGNNINSYCFLESPVSCMVGGFSRYWQILRYPPENSGTSSPENPVQPPWVICCIPGELSAPSLEDLLPLPLANVGWYIRSDPGSAGLLG